jgi:hypothetical protein
MSVRRAKQLCAVNPRIDRQALLRQQAPQVPGHKCLDIAGHHLSGTKHRTSHTMYGVLRSASSKRVATATRAGVRTATVRSSRRVTIDPAFGNEPDLVANADTAGQLGLGG